MVSHRKYINRRNHLWPLGLVLFFAFLSLGAWWGKDKSEKKMVNEPVKNSPVSAPVSKEEHPPLKQEAKTAAQLPAGPELKREEVEGIQKDLKEIIDRTHELQNQVKGNRLEIQRILDRTRIHERILRTMDLPRPIPTKQLFNADAIVKREKLRLIAEQARQTRERLQVIQQVQALNKAPKLAPTVAKAPKSS